MPYRSLFRLLPFRRALTRAACLALAALSMASRQAVAAPAAESPGGSAGSGQAPLSLDGSIPFHWGFQGETQAAGSPNQMGVGFFLPLSSGAQSIFFLDALANVNLSDRSHSSSIDNTEVAGTTISTSTRLGYRWLTGSSSWMFGVNAGYDSRPMATGNADNGLQVSGSRTVFFQQLAANLEAASERWNFNVYALVPVGNTEYQLNNIYQGGSLDTYGLEAGYRITPDLIGSIGYYYQNGDLSAASGSGVTAKLTYTISNGLVVGTTLSYDNAFDTRFSANVQYRFGSSGYGAPRKLSTSEQAVIQTLSGTPGHRNIRVQDILAVPMSNGDTVD
jgi:hypothetical protein